MAGAPALVFTISAPTGVAVFTILAPQAGFTISPFYHFMPA